MAYFEDLQPCTPFAAEWKNPLAVGWLTKGHAYRRGARDHQLARQLTLLANGSVLEADTEFRRCELCGPDEIARGSSGVILVPSREALYVAPRLIEHFIRKHGYLPPEELTRALRELPRQRDFEAALDLHRVRPRGIQFSPADSDGYSDITVLEGLEPVRVRPAMYIGSTGAAGLTHLLFEVVSNSFDEYLRGFASKLRVEVDQRGWVIVEDDGRGIPVDERPGAGITALEAIFTRLHSGSTLDGHRPHVHIQPGPYGVGIAPVNALCARLEVESRRSGSAYRAAFEAGVLVEPLRCVGDTPKRGTLIRFLPDDEIFDEGAAIDLRKVEDRLHQLSWLASGLEVSFQQKLIPHAGGLPGWVKRLAPDVITETLLEVRDTSRRVDVVLTLGWSPNSTGTRVVSFVNYQPTIDGGSHAEGVVAAVAAAASARNTPREKLLEGLVAVVHIGLLDAAFGGPTTTLLHMDEARQAVEEVVTRAINEAPWWWDRLHEAIG
jgi:hypothetical protein